MAKSGISKPSQALFVQEYPVSPQFSQMSEHAVPTDSSISVDQNEQGNRRTISDLPFTSTASTKNQLKKDAYFHHPRICHIHVLMQLSLEYVRFLLYNSDR